MLAGSKLFLLSAVIESWFQSANSNKLARRPVCNCTSNSDSSLNCWWYCCCFFQGQIQLNQNWLHKNFICVRQRIYSNSLIILRHVNDVLSLYCTLLAFVAIKDILVNGIGSFFHINEYVFFRIKTGLNNVPGCSLDLIFIACPHFC